MAGRRKSKKRPNKYNPNRPDWFAVHATRLRPRSLPAPLPVAALLLAAQRGRRARTR